MITNYKKYIENLFEFYKLVASLYKNNKNKIAFGGEFLYDPISGYIIIKKLNSPKTVHELIHLKLLDPNNQKIDSIRKSIIKKFEEYLNEISIKNKEEIPKELRGLYLHIFENFDELIENYYIVINGKISLIKKEDPTEISNTDVLNNFIKRLGKEERYYLLRAINIWNLEKVNIKFENSELEEILNKFEKRVKEDRIKYWSKSEGLAYLVEFFLKYKVFPDLEELKLEISRSVKNQEVVKYIAKSIIRELNNLSEEEKLEKIINWIKNPESYYSIFR